MANALLWALGLIYLLVWLYALYLAVKKNRLSWVVAIIFVPVFAIIYLIVKKGK